MWKFHKTMNMHSHILRLSSCDAPPSGKVRHSRSMHVASCDVAPNTGDLVSSLHPSQPLTVPQETGKITARKGGKFGGCSSRCSRTWLGWRRVRSDSCIHGWQSKRWEWSMRSQRTKYDKICNMKWLISIATEKINEKFHKKIGNEVFMWPPAMHRKPRKHLPTSFSNS